MDEKRVVVFDTTAFSLEKSHQTQLDMAKHIIFEDSLTKNPILMAGVDVAYSKNLSIAVAAILDYRSLKLVESQIAICNTPFPNIPTLLSFREIAPSISCIKKLRNQPDLFLIDGHGFAHPYRCGFASHLSLLIRMPTIGVAKNKLIGEVERVWNKENIAFLKQNNEVIGAEVIPRKGHKPIYISVGHMVSLETAIKIVKHCIHSNRIPKPILKAHEIANKVKQKVNVHHNTER